MPAEGTQVRVEFTAEFKRNLRILAKKYRHIRSDIQPAIESIQKGDWPGDRISGTRFVIYKVRVRNRDTGKGKAEGIDLFII